VLLECPYHGWAFGPDGACHRIPGWPPGVPRPTRRAEAVSVYEHDRLVWVTLGENGAPPPRCFTGQDDPAFDSFIWVSDARCTLVDGLENLLDATHPSFVHAGLVRWAPRRRPVVVDVRRTAERVEAVYTENAVAGGLLPRLLEGMRTVSIGRYFPPSSAQLEYRGPRGPRFLLTAMFTPVDENRVRVHAVVATPRGRLPAVLKTAALRAAFAQVVRQDRRTLARQQANIARFGGPAFNSSAMDVMRPHILYFLNRRNGEPATPYAATFTMEL
jgi:phenylpropionate dioxygenase-like ring-hydroxylating dioxygenase large terminal subunit